MAKNTRTFIDLDLNFGAHPVTGDVTKKFDVEAIKASVKNLVLTNHYERPFHPEIGSSVRGLLFEPTSPVTARMLEKAISEVIINFEPRVQLLGVQVQFSPDNNSVYVAVQFSIVNTSTPQVVNFTLERTR